MKNIVIVESPTKARTLTRFLGNGYTIGASGGHIRDLPKSKLGIDIEDNFTPTYITPPEKKKNITQLKKLVKTGDRVFLATDPDREGEAIAWHLAQALRLSGGKTPRRIVFHEITEHAVKEALAHPRSIDMNLVNAQQARRILDRLVGYTLSPLLWRKVRRGLSAGRVQSVALRLIVDREEERDAFTPEEYWSVDGEFEKDHKTFRATLIKIDEKKAVVKDKKTADTILSDLHNAQYFIDAVQEKRVTRRPAPPFTTSTLQQAASGKLGFSARRTMAVAQRLYEEGLITYMRTDSVTIANQARDAVRVLIGKEFGTAYVPEKPRVYVTKSKLAQEAHEAIRPTRPDRRPEEVKTAVDRDAGRLYRLIWQRMLASQMADARLLQGSIDIRAKKRYLFRATGMTVTFDGWLKLFPPKEELQKLPRVAIKEPMTCKKIDATQHFTEPPPRYSEATLIKTLEELGIGRPSTYAPTLSIIQQRQYVERIERRLVPTELGKAVTLFLKKHFADIVDVQFTAGLEDKLDAIAHRNQAWIPVLNAFYTPYAKHVQSVEDTADRVKVEAEKTGESCPKCGKELLLRIGRFGRFVACSGFPECRYTKPFLVKLEMKCPDCQKGEVIVRKTRKGKVFYGCSQYPKCKFASWTKPKVEENPKHQAQNSK